MPRIYEVYNKDSKQLVDEVYGIFTPDSRDTDGTLVYKYRDTQEPVNAETASQFFIKKNMYRTFIGNF